MATSDLVESFKRSFRRFFPSGRAWDGDDFKKIVDTYAFEFCRVQERFNTFLKELDPRQTSELLTDWEIMLGLPDDCSTPGATVEERRNQVVQKLTNTGGSSFEYFEGIAENLGFDVTVSDFTPFFAGQAKVGDKLHNDPVWTYWFQVTAPSDITTTFKAGVGKAGDKLVEVGNETLECTFDKLKPAHTNVLFAFTA